ncbi:MAG TPA: GH116 family glycosyl hydrolase [Candidatus Lokiarchaeia archaeon]|nr:GH116 family glycosyl hydrolase [Candidatus Lokiarchaeia archaeon]
MTNIHGTIAQTSGIPLGGIGTGSTEIWADGYFHEWLIFNLGSWAPRQPGRGKKKQPNMESSGFTFYLRTKDDSGVKMRRLGMRTDQHDMYSLAWLKSVQGIDYDGKFPVVRLRYIDDSLPVNVSAELFSPFQPHDARTSGTPGFYVIFTIKNNSSNPVDVSLLSILANPLAIDAKDRLLKNTITTSNGATILTMRTGATKCYPATIGSMALSAKGGNITWIAADFAQYFRSITMWPDHTNLSALAQYRLKGALPNLGNDAPCPSGAVKFLPKLKGSAKKTILADELKQYAFAQDLRDRYNEVDESILSHPEGVNNFLMQVTGFLFGMIRHNAVQANWGTGALSSSMILQPGESTEVQFALSWYLPNHYSQKGEKIGHMYENWFKDAEDVNKFLLDNSEKLRKGTEAFSNALFETTLDPDLADAWAGQLTTIPKCTWWVKNGDFGVWEGLGCCGFHTTDITYQGSFNLLALFPELQQRQMLMGARFMREDGRIPHFFTPDLSHVDRGFDRVDMNPQFVLLVCRDYLWTGDKVFLQQAWPYIVRAMENSQLLDTDEDGLPDHDTRRNTYDGWNFFGTPSYIASLWIGALRASVRMAKDLDDCDNLNKWHALLDKAVPNFQKKLWNGEYFSLWVDGERRDEMCMTDQMSGEWFTRIIGLGNSLPKDSVVNALSAVFKNNFSPESGLVNATYPAGKKPLFPAHYNMQALAPWTGVEYAIGSMMLDIGMITEGTQVVKTIHDRYTRAGRFWNHVECGDHYYRAMCSWAVLLASTGFKVDIPAQSIRIAPFIIDSDVKMPWFSSTAWGSASWTGNTFEMNTMFGSQKVKELRLNRNPASSSATIGDTAVSFSTAEQDGDFILTFDDVVELLEGTSIVIQ